MASKGTCGTVKRLEKERSKLRELYKKDIEWYKKKLKVKKNELENVQSKVKQWEELEGNVNLKREQLEALQKRLDEKRLSLKDIYLPGLTVSLTEIDIKLIIERDLALLGEEKRKNNHHTDLVKQLQQTITKNMAKHEKDLKDKEALLNEEISKASVLREENEKQKQEVLKLRTEIKDKSQRQSEFLHRSHRLLQNKIKTSADLVTNLVSLAEADSKRMNYLMAIANRIKNAEGEKEIEPERMKQYDSYKDMKKEIIKLEQESPKPEKNLEEPKLNKRPILKSSITMDTLKICSLQKQVSKLEKENNSLISENEELQKGRNLAKAEVAMLMAKAKEQMVDQQAFNIQLPNQSNSDKNVLQEKEKLEILTENLKTEVEELKAISISNECKELQEKYDDQLIELTLMKEKATADEEQRDKQAKEKKMDTEKLYNEHERAVKKIEEEKDTEIQELKLHCEWEVKEQLRKQNEADASFQRLRALTVNLVLRVGELLNINHDDNKLDGITNYGQKLAGLSQLSQQKLMNALKELTDCITRDLNSILESKDNLFCSLEDMKTRNEESKRDITKKKEKIKQLMINLAEAKDINDRDSARLKSLEEENKMNKGRITSLEDELIEYKVTMKVLEKNKIINHPIKREQLKKDNGITTAAVTSTKEVGQIKTPPLSSPKPQKKQVKDSNRSSALANPTPCEMHAKASSSRKRTFQPQIPCADKFRVVPHDNMTMTAPKMAKPHFLPQQNCHNQMEKPKNMVQTKPMAMGNHNQYHPLPNAYVADSHCQRQTGLSHEVSHMHKKLEMVQEQQRELQRQFQQVDGAQSAPKQMQLARQAGIIEPPRPIAPIAVPTSLNPTAPSNVKFQMSQYHHQKHPNIQQQPPPQPLLTYESLSDEDKKLCHEIYHSVTEAMEFMETNPRTPTYQTRDVVYNTLANNVYQINPRLKNKRHLVKLMLGKAFVERFGVLPSLKDVIGPEGDMNTQ